VEGNSIHPWRGVGDIVDNSRLFQLKKEVISTELNVLAHEGCIHTHEVERKHFIYEVFFDLDGTVNSLPDTDRARRFEYVIVEDSHSRQPGKVTVKSFMMADELIHKS
jgi:hypothetical protein